MNTRAIPSPRQIEFLNWEFGVFFHFGIRSFYPGHKDWDNLPMDAAAFNPDRLDCEQWIRASREAGARYAILVCKHHDGFANWPTKYSDYSVAATPWKDGKGDVVREFVDACRKYDVKVGLYYSPAQWGGQTAFAEGREYDDYFINQISELLTNYGKIDYLWFDGCGSEGHEYDRARIIQAIRGLQPDILIFQMWDPDTRWVGNEDGYAPLRNVNLCDEVDFSMMTEEREQMDQTRYLPAECDCKMRSTWFDCEPNEGTIKEVDELVGMYEMSVGRGANFLLNIGPDCHGRLPEPDLKRLEALGREIRRRYCAPIPAFGGMQSEGNGAWSICTEHFSEDWENEDTCPQLVNRVVIEEDLMAQSPVEEFRIYAHLPGYRSKRVCVYKGDTVGHKAICAFPTIRTAKLTVEACGKGGPVLTGMRAYYVRPENGN